MSSSRDSRHAYMQELINRAKFTLIQSPPNLYSGCGSAAKVGARTFDFDEFIGRLNDDNINNFQQKELLKAFTKVKSGKLVISHDVFSRHEQNAIYEYIRDNSMAQDANIAFYSQVLTEKLVNITPLPSTRMRIWGILCSHYPVITGKFTGFDNFLQYIVDNEVSSTTLEKINDLLFEKLGIRLPEKTSDLSEETSPKITAPKSEKPAKVVKKPPKVVKKPPKKGGSRKTRRSKSNRRRNKTYRR